MNLDDVPIEKLKSYLGDDRFEYFKNNGSLESISAIKYITFVCKCFQRKIYNNAKQLSFVPPDDVENFVKRLLESFYAQQCFELIESVDLNIRSLSNIVKKQTALYSLLVDIQAYNDIVRVYTEKSNMQFSPSYPIKENNIVSLFCSRFQNVDLPNSELVPSDLTPEDEIIFKKLQELTQTILIFYIRKNNNYLVYGSYSLHLFNENIIYNDIDLYSADPTQIANILAFIAYWVYGVIINVHLNPLILHYLSIEFKKSHVFDILYLNRESQIAYKEIKDTISILKIEIQFFNFFRSLTDFHRMKVFQDKPENTELKLITIVSKLSTKYNIKLSNTTIASSLYDQMRYTKLYTLEDVSYLMIPAKILPFETPYSYIFIFIADYHKLIEALPNDSIFFKRHSGVYNEIVAEIPKNANTNKRIRLKSQITLNGNTSIAVGVELENINLGDDFFDEIKKSKVLVLSNVYSKLFVDKNTATLEPISFLNIFASIGLALFLNNQLEKTQQRKFLVRMFEYMNCFTIAESVEKLREEQLFITAKRRTREPHRNFQPALKMHLPFSLFFEKPMTKRDVFSKSEYQQIFR